MEKPFITSWTFSPVNFSEQKLSTLLNYSKSIGISKEFLSILVNRGCDSVDKINNFINPRLNNLPNLLSWSALHEAAKEIDSWIMQGVKFAIWGDYDVDGITSTALLTSFFRMRTKSVPVPHIPDRQTSGYGLNLKEIEELFSQGIRAIITVDCGISDIECISFANSIGMKIVITDHHLPSEPLPSSIIFVNPHLANTPYKKLAGVGVAFILAATLNKILPDKEIDMRQFLDLVALGSLADMAFLDEINRILVKNGMLYLKDTTRYGITALKTECSIQPNIPLDTEKITFKLAPRINAAGRLFHANTALNLLLATDIKTASYHANELSNFNIARRTMESKIYDQALAKLHAQGTQPAYVLHSEDWHPGIVGIVAGRLVEASGVPCILLSHKDGNLRGSGRSVPNIDLHNAVEKTKESLIRFGGHAQAVGLTLKKENFDIFYETFINAIINAKPIEIFDKYQTPIPISFQSITADFIKELEILEPFGPGNLRPVFISKKLKVVSSRMFMENKHISLVLREPGQKISFQGICWRFQDKTFSQALLQKELKILFYPHFNIYKGIQEIQLTILNANNNDINIS